jgi:GT2 family glycosyltransferase
MTLDCVASVEAHTERGLYEIIVVDNGSAPEEVAMLTGASERFKLVPLNRNMFFGEASNIGAERGSGELLLFLNNDVEVTARWLEPLLATLDGADRAGAVGPKIVHPNGELLEAGCFIRPDGWGIQVGKSGMPLPPGWADATRIVDYCSGACLLMRRDAFLALGGFDPIFDPAYFEDADLAVRLRAIGLFTYYCGATAVRHLESVTSNRIWTREVRDRHIAANHGRLVARWGGYLRDRIARDIDPVPLPPVTWQPERPSSGKGQVVFYAPDPFRADAAGEALLRAASACQDRYEVILAADEVFSRCRVYSLCRELRIDLAAFAVRQMAGIDQSRCRSIVTSGIEAGRTFPAPHIDLARDGEQGLRLLDGAA